MPSGFDSAYSPVRLAIKSTSGNKLTAVLAKRRSQPVEFFFEGLGRSLVLPDNLDGFLAVVLPAIMRADGAVHVAGTLTRQLVRNLIDASEGWKNWNSKRYRSLRLSADYIIDPPVPTSLTQAAFAWSGSLRSTHTLVRHYARRVPGAVQVTRLVHVVGLQGKPQAGYADAIAAEVSNQAERLGMSLDLVVTNAREVGLVEPEIGPLPLVAAALHLTCADIQLAFHARRWPFSAQLRFPRPEPAFPDVFSGSRMLVRADGGTATPTQMVRDIRECAPFLLGTINGCSDRPRFTSPCGECSGCIITSLAFAAAGMSHQALPRPTEAELARLPWDDPIVAAEATEIAADWSLPRSHTYLALSHLVRTDRAKSARTEVSRWFASAMGLGPIWPR